MKKIINKILIVFLLTMIFTIESNASMTELHDRITDHNKVNIINKDPSDLKNSDECDWWDGKYCENEIAEHMVHKYVQSILDETNTEEQSYSAEVSCSTKNNCAVTIHDINLFDNEHGVWGDEGISEEYEISYSGYTSLSNVESMISTGNTISIDSIDVSYLVNSEECNSFENQYCYVDLMYNMVSDYVANVYKSNNISDRIIEYNVSCEELEEGKCNIGLAYRAGDDLLSSSEISKEYTIDFTGEYDVDKYAEANDIIDGLDNEYNLVDLAFVNQLYNFKQNRSNFFIDENTLNIFPKIKSFIENNDEYEFTPVFYGMGSAGYMDGKNCFMYLKNNGTIYGVSSVGFYNYHIIFIDDQTENTTAAYQTAATNKIKNYINNDDIDVSIEFEPEKILEYRSDEDLKEDRFDVSYTVNRFFEGTYESGIYKLTIDNYVDEYVLIVAVPSELLNQLESEVKAFDNNSKISIETSAPNVPYDTKVSVINVSEDINVINTTKNNDYDLVVAYDLDLHSYFSNKYITEINGLVTVCVPIDNDYSSNEISILRISDDGEILQTYEANIIIKDNQKYATFSTNHFSTYALASQIENQSVSTTPVVTVTNTTYNKNVISYDKVEGASGYKIYYATSNTGKYTLLKTTTALSYTHSNLKTGTTYYYKVKSYKVENKKNVYSSYSEVKSAKATLRPTVLTGVENNYRYTKITWTKVSGASGYRVYRSTTQDGTYTYLGKTTSLLYYDKNTTEGNTYYYKVKAYRVVSGKTKYSLYSNIVSTNRLSDKITFNVTSNSYRSTKITINKDPNATTYYVYRATSKTGKYTLVKTILASEEVDGKLTYINTGLTFNKTYYYKVKMKYVNVSDYSGYKSVKVVLSAPTIDVEGIQLTENRVIINKVTGATGYQIYRALDDGKFTKIKTQAELTYDDLGLTLGKELDYKYKVRAYKKVGTKTYYSAFSDTESMPPFEEQ